MYLSFAQRMNLRPGDVIITPKNIFLKIIEHYLVYLGINQFGQEVYIENDYRNGVQCITDEHFCFKNPAFKGIRRFTGDETQRYWACERAKSLLSAKLGHSEIDVLCKVAPFANLTFFAIYTHFAKLALLAQFASARADRLYKQFTSLNLYLTLLHPIIFFPYSCLPFQLAWLVQW